MSKFWGVVGFLFVIGIAMILLGNQTAANGINFSDLETECRYNYEETNRISVNAQNNRLGFEGKFPVNNTRSDLKYSYEVSEGEIILNIIPEDRERPSTYVNTCLGIVNYKAQTDRIEDGRYRVEIQHDGKRVEERVLVLG